MSSQIPATVDIELVRGDDFESNYFQILTVDKLNPTVFPTGLIYEPTVIDGFTFTPLNLTGATVMSQVRKSTAYASELVISFTVTVIDVLNGIYKLSLTNTQTTTMAMNDAIKYSYDTQVVTSEGKITTYIKGAVNITLDITR